MKLYTVVMILSLLHLSTADQQEDYWPVHTACNSDKIQVIYRSCDPIQDVGFTLSSCTDIQSQPYVKASILLRQSIDALYLSLDMFHNGNFVVHYDESICLPNFPRFNFCGSRKGEMIDIQTFLPDLEIALKGHYNLKAHLINQNGFQIGCVNATVTFQ